MNNSKEMNQNSNAQSCSADQGSITFRLLESFFANAYDGIFIVDKNGKLLLANPSIVRLLGTSLEELEGIPIDQIIAKGYYENSPSLKSLKTGQIAIGLVKTRSGLEIMSISKPVFNSSGELELVITNCRPLDSIIQFLKKYRIVDPKKGMSFSSAIDVSSSQKLIFNSPVMKDLMVTVDMISKADSSVIIYGQSGTGKSVLAKYIHQSSNRASYSFVEINCAAIPENLMESELFGYEKGAFTGANAQGKLGLFEIADGGTIFMDEIGEMSLAMQAKLLKILDSGYIMRVGGTVYHKVNTRVIVATNRDLRQMVKEGQFREDLFYRLNVVPITIPPLSKRIEDIIPIAEQILSSLNSKYLINKVFSDSTRETMLLYNWPGNIRHLGNVIERFYIITPGSVINIQSSDLAEPSLRNSQESSDLRDQQLSSYYGGTLKEFVERTEFEYITHVIRECGGSFSRAAKELGVHRTLLYKKLNRMTENNER
ncbi:MAG: AAA family ATPase [Clostridia bacterium]|nr:AAA family ATPase [Clostridia bacterium]